MSQKGHLNCDLDLKMMNKGAKLHPDPSKNNKVMGLKDFKRFFFTSDIYTVLIWGTISSKAVNNQQIYWPQWNLKKKVNCDLDL